MSQAMARQSQNEAQDAELDKSYPIKYLTTENVGKALETLGGELDRSTTSHDTNLWKLPGGKRVSVSYRAKRVHKSALKSLLRTIEQSGVPLPLFLALADDGGRGWNKIPPVVSKVKEMLKSAGYAEELKDIKLQRKIVDSARKALTPKKTKPSGAPAPAQQETQSIAADYPHKVNEVCYAAALTAEGAKHYTKVILGYVRYKNSIGYYLHQEGQVRIVAHGAMNRYFVNDAGADRIMRWIRERDKINYPKLFAEREAKEAQEKEAALPPRPAKPTPPQPVVEPPKPQPEPPTPDVKPAKGPIFPAPATPAPRKPEPLPGNAVIQLCQHFGVSPAWKDGITLDLEKTLIVLAQALDKEEV